MKKWQKDILAKLDKYTGFELEQAPDFLSIQCKNPESFHVSISEMGQEFRVAFDGWHEHFENGEEALNCFAFGLSESCRLKVQLRAEKECSWTVQHRTNGEWVDDSTTGLIFTQFWRQKRVEFRHNILLLKRTAKW